MRKTTLRSIVRLLVKALTRTRFVGLENVPVKGALIIATNHMHYMDIPLLFINPVREDLTALVTTKYQHHWFIRWFCDTAGGIWINRDIADFNAMQAASKALKEERALGISPEGTRSHTAQLLQAKPGTVLLALKMGAADCPGRHYRHRKGIPADFHASAPADHHPFWSSVHPAAGWTREPRENVPAIYG